MLEYCDFDVKESVNGDDGRLTPDLIVRLPGGKNVVVDAKVPSSAFLDAMETDAEAAARREDCALTRARCATTSSSWATRPTGSTSSRRRTS